MKTGQSSHTTGSKHHPLEIPAQFLDDNNSWKALTKQEKAMLTEAQLYAYERFWMAIHDEEFHIETKYLEGIEEGRAKERMNNARKLKENGVPLDIIAKSLSLTDEEIAQISR